MRQYRSETEGRFTRLGAALAATLALGAMVDGLFAPASTSSAAQANATFGRPAAVEVAIVPSRIEVVGVRTPAVAQGEGDARAASPGS